MGWAYADDMLQANDGVVEVKVSSGQGAGSVSAPSTMSPAKTGELALTDGDLSG